MFSYLKVLVPILFVLICVTGCGEEGEEGSTGTDCGEHGTEHDGHCHCDPGYLFNGEACVPPSEITEICEAQEDGGTEEEEEHEDHACRCPETGECHCDHGEIVTLEGVNFCQPELHEE